MSLNDFPRRYVATPALGSVLSKKVDCFHSRSPGGDHSCDCGSCEPGPGGKNGQTCESEILERLPRPSIIPVIIEAAFLLLSVGLLLMGDLFGLQAVVGNLSISFVAIMVEAMPFLLIGSLIGGL